MIKLVQLWEGYYTRQVSFIFKFGKNTSNMKKYIYSLIFALSFFNVNGQISLEASVGYDYIGLSRGVQNSIGLTRSASRWNYGLRLYSSKSIGFNSFEPSQRSNIIKLPNSEPLDLSNPEAIDMYMDDLATSGLYSFTPVTYSYYTTGIELNLQYNVKLGRGWSISPRFGLGLGYFESSYLASQIFVTSINAPAISDPSDLVIYQPQYESYLAIPWSTYLILSKELNNGVMLSAFSSLNFQKEIIRSSAVNLMVSVPI